MTRSLRGHFTVMGRTVRSTSLDELWRPVQGRCQDDVDHSNFQVWASAVINAQSLTMDGKARVTISHKDMASVHAWVKLLQLSSSLQQLKCSCLTKTTCDSSRIKQCSQRCSSFTRGRKLSLNINYLLTFLDFLKLPEIIFHPFSLSGFPNKWSPWKWIEEFVFSIISVLQNTSIISNTTANSS